MYAQQIPVVVAKITIIDPPPVLSQEYFEAIDEGMKCFVLSLFPESKRV